MDVNDSGFQNFIVHQMTLGDLEFWWDAYAILNASKPIKVIKIKKLNTPEAIKKRVEQWPEE